MQQFLALIWAMITTVLVAPVRSLHSTIVSAFSSPNIIDRPDPVPKRRLFINMLVTAITVPVLVASIALGSTSPS